MARIGKGLFPLLIAAALPCRATIFTVTSTNDSGAGSLRGAISNANFTVNSGGPDEIHFSIAGAGVHTIKPASALPAITDPVVIDGYTQTNAVPNTLTNGDNAVLLIELNGGAAGANVSGLTINAGNCKVRGLVINGFNGSGISLFVNGGNLVEGNFIGTDPTGKVAVTNGFDGVAINVGNNLIGGTTLDARNVLSGNGLRGVDIFGSNATNNIVKGNFIGTDVTGTNGLPNAAEGVSIFDGASDNVIGRPEPLARNLISGNGSDGVIISGSNCTGNAVLGNFIGTDVTGTNYLPNVGSGVNIFQGYGNLVGAAPAGSGNIVSGNHGNGVVIADAHATGNSIRGNFIGTDVTGTRVISNSAAGVSLNDGSGNLIGGTEAGAGNVLSGNGASGVFIGGGNTTTSNLVQGNLIGTDVTGTGALRNAGEGVWIYNGFGNTIGGTNGAARNLISGNGFRGVLIGGGGPLPTGNFVQGNFIGTDLTGTKAIPNLQSGIVASAPSNIVGGASVGAGNLISGNAVRGVSINAGATNTIVQNNLIGTDITGTNALPNQNSGVGIFGPGNLIGGSVAAARNVISGNALHGVTLSGSTANSNLVQGNFIGTDISGLFGVGNRSNGVFIAGGSANFIGDTNAGAGNFIAFNGLAGVGLGSGSTNNAIRANSIFSNSALGIDLLTNGVTANDACDLDTGPNNSQNFPVLTAGTNRVGSTTISGTLSSASNSTFALDFYANLACDASGFGQGRTYLGSTNVTIDASCNASFTLTLATPVLTNQFLTATATDTSNNTSEFSACVPIAFDPDANHDGLPDLWQFHYFGCVTCPDGAPTADPDGDGQNNLAEFLAGTDPTNNGSVFRITAIAREGGDLRVTWTCGAGRTNMLQTAAGSLTNNFVDLPPQIFLNGAGVVTTNRLDIGAATNAPRYYRVRLVQ